MSSSSGLRAVRSLNSQEGEPSPDVLFSRRPSTNGPATTSSVKKVPPSGAAKSSVPQKQPRQQQKKKSDDKKVETKKPAAKKLAAAAASSSSSSSVPPSLPESTQRQPASPRSPSTSCTCTCSCTTCSGGEPSSDTRKQQQQQQQQRDNEQRENKKKYKATLAKLTKELAASQTLKLTLEEKCRHFENTAKEKQTLYSTKLSEFEVAKSAWQDRERELVTAGTSTLSRERESEEQCNAILAQLAASQKEMAQLRASHEEEHQSAQAHLFAVSAETEEYRARVTELEERMTESMKELETTKDVLEKAKTAANETTQTLVQAAWTEAEETIKKEKKKLTLLKRKRHC